MRKLYFFGLVFLMLLLIGCAPTETLEVDDTTIVPEELEAVATETAEATETAVPTETPLPTTTDVPVLPSSTPEPTEESDDMPPEAEEQAPIPAGVEPLVDMARQDLAQRQKIEEDQITFVSFEAKVWPDSAYGCPQPGMMYMQVLKEGYLIRLQAGTQVYDYHGGEGKAPFLCEQDKDA